MSHHNIIITCIHRTYTISLLLTNECTTSNFSRYTVISSQLSSCEIQTQTISIQEFGIQSNVYDEIAATWKPIQVIV